MSDATEQSGLERAAEDTHIVQMLKQGINITVFFRYKHDGKRVTTHDTFHTAQDSN